MNVAMMRRADRLLGVPACFALSLLRKLWDRPPPADARPKSFIFIKLAEQGSTVLAYPALKAAIDRVGAENVYFLVFEENRPILDAMQVIPEVNVIAIRAKGILRTVLGAMSAIRKMRGKRIDAAIDLEFFARSSAALAFLSGARWRSGFHSYGGEASYRGNLMTHPLSFNAYLHTSQTFQTLVEAIDYPGEAFPTFPLVPPPKGKWLPRFVPAPEELEEVRGILAKASGSTTPSPLVLLNANASDLLPLRRWESSRYVELARRMLAMYPELRIAFTGAPEEAAPVNKLVADVASDRCFSLAGKTSLRQLLVVYCLADVLVTNDSDPALRNAYRYRRHHAFRPGNADAFCRSHPSQPCSVVGDCLQPLRQRLQ
ncbi:MAG: glycosyltransferase family 9 protein [Planctomycetota bacterium]